MSMRQPRKTVIAALLGLGTLTLAACGGSSAGLIPARNAGPLQSAFEEVQEAARKGNGKCGPTEAALAKAKRAFNDLPTSVDASLRNRLSEGIVNLTNVALTECKQPSSSGATTTGTSTTKSTTSRTTPTTSTTNTATETSESESTTTPSTSSSPPKTGGTAPEVETHPGGEGGPTESGGGEAPSGRGPTGEGPPGHGGGNGQEGPGD